MTRPVVLLGAGGYARTVLQILRMRRDDVRGCVGLEPDRPASYALEVPYLGDDTAALTLDAAQIALVNAVGSVGPPITRRELFQRYKTAGFRFETLVHPRAVLADDVHMEEGAHVHANAVLQPGAVIGANAIVNTGASVDHDCRIGAHAHLAPGVVFSGNVVVGECAHVGTGAIVIQGIHIGAGATVAAGAVVVSAVAQGRTVMGAPARPRNG